MSDYIRDQQAIAEQEEPFDTSDKASVNKARKKAARTRADRLKFVAAAMQHPEGRSWFYDIMNRCTIFGNPFEGEESHRTAFKLGEQNIGKMLLADVLEAAPEQYMNMIIENKK